MVFTVEDKALIKNVYLLKGYGAHSLHAEFPTKNWTLGGLANHAGDVAGHMRDFWGILVQQRDGAPAHRARDTVQLLERETPAFISPEMWPPNSPDLNRSTIESGGDAAACLSKENKYRGRVEAAPG